MRYPSRRTFLGRSVHAAAGVAAADLAFLSSLQPVRAQETKVDPRAVQFRPEIEPLVRFLEDTPRGKLLEGVGAKIRAGTTYREVLTGLLLAGVRNVQPRPSVGSKFHAVLVVNSAHLASLSSPDRDRWLPIFWALDYFKSSQARDVREGNWTMPPVNENHVPSFDKAPGAFRQAMDSWDVAAIDTAVTGLARTKGAAELFEQFALYGARDFRSIGHKAIFVANSWRALQCIGWQHAEPVLRSLAYALLNHRGEPNPSKSDLAADRPWRANQQRAKKIRKGWMRGKLDPTATTRLLATLRSGTPDDACDMAVELLNAGVSPQSIYDALFLGSSELLVRQSGVVALHAPTTTNAMHYAFRMVGSDRSRQLLLLQNVAFLPLFRDAMGPRGKVREANVMELLAASETVSTTEDVFASVQRNNDEAAQKSLAWLSNGGSPKQFIDDARRLVFLKGTDSHDYKYSSAVLEDCYSVSPEFRNRYLAASVFKLRGSEERDNGLVKRIQSALT